MADLGQKKVPFAFGYPGRLQVLLRCRGGAEMLAACWRNDNKHCERSHSVSQGARPLTMLAGAHRAFMECSRSTRGAPGVHCAPNHFGRNLVPFDCICLEMHATFEVLVIRRQEELSGPSQHIIVRIIMSHNSPDDLRAFGVLYMRFQRQCETELFFGRARPNRSYVVTRSWILVSSSAEGCSEHAVIFFEVS